MAEVWTVLSILRWTTDYFTQKGIEGGRREAEILLAHTLGIDRVGLYVNFEKPLQPEELATFRRLIQRRARHEPTQYILGETEFWSLPFSVGPQVLIPRADTEVLIEEALERINPEAPLLDVGTGSGAIAVTLAHEVERLQVEAIDLSPDALAMATANAVRNGVVDRVRFRQEDLAAISGGGYGMIVSNPPYIPQGDIAGLMPEVRDHEPVLALAGGADGLDCYRLLATQAPTLLIPGGWLLVEVGIGQSEQVSTLFAAAGGDSILVRNDYAGIPRVVGARFGG